MSNRRYILDLSNEKAFRSDARLLYVSSAKYGGDWHSVPHSHSFAELFYAVGGKGQFHIGESLYAVKPNDMVIVNPNVIHTEVSYNASPLEYIVLGIEGLTLSDSHGDGGFCILDCQGSGSILACLRSILREMAAQEPGYESVCQAYVDILLIWLMRRISFSVTAAGTAPQAKQPCVTARRYIDAHYKEPITLDILAEEAHVNKYYLVHAFKEEYGVSPISYLISRRIEESRYLLRETDLSLSQIARILGFSSASYFSQSFRRAENRTPMEYRKDIN